MKAGSIIKLPAYLLMLLIGIVMSSCDDVIFDDEGNCVVRYRVRFKYDYNMKFADAFPAEVEQVTLYVIDGDGKIVWQKTESGGALKKEGYAMDVDVAPGTYSLLAWCSSENPATFTIGNDGTAHSLKTDFFTDRHDDGTHHIAKNIDRLYHGYVANVNFPVADEGDFVYTIPLTKDTNHFVITLQQLSGEALDKDLIKFEIYDDNAHLDWDNSPRTGTPLTYHEWYKANVSADINAKSADDVEVKSTEDNGKFSGVVAELTTSRLMMSNRGNARLRIYRNDTGETIASIRLIDALLLVKGYENSKRLTDQQYLDYKDEYNMTFFLDQNHHWLSSVIQIESWRVVYKELEIH